MMQRGKERILVLADLHIGWEVALAQEGIHIPSQTPKMKNTLMRLIDLFKPTGLLVLGDVKHTIAGVELGEWQDIPDLFEALSHKINDIEVILGNHDGNLEPLLPQSIKILPQTGIALFETGFFHGNAWPSPELLQCRSLVIGHVHPTVTFRDPLGFRISAQVWVKAKINRKGLAWAFLKGMGVRVKSGDDPFNLLYQHFNIRFKASELLILPYFNAFLGGRPINRGTSERRAKSVEYLGPILRSKSVDMENAETFLLDGTFLGTIKQLRRLS